MTHINLFPTRVRRRHLLRRRVWQWGFACALTAIGCGWQGVAHYRRSETSRAELVTLQQRQAPFGRMQEEINSIRGRIEDLRTQERLGMELADQRSMTTLLGVLSRSSEQCDRNICVRRFALSRQLNARSDKSPIANSLLLEGLGASHLDVARFMTLLSDEGIFDSVELKRSAPHEIGGVNVRSYELECTF